MYIHLYHQNLMNLYFFFISFLFRFILFFIILRLNSHVIFLIASIFHLLFKYIYDFFVSIMLIKISFFHIFYEFINHHLFSLLFIVHHESFIRIFFIFIMHLIDFLIILVNLIFPLSYLYRIYSINSYVIVGLNSYSFVFRSIVLLIKLLFLFSNI